MSSTDIVQKASIKAFASLTLVISGVLWSMAARRMRYPLVSSRFVWFFGTLMMRAKRWAAIMSMTLPEGVSSSGQATI